MDATNYYLNGARASRRLLVLRLGFNSHYFSFRSDDGDDDRPTAHAAVFDVLLMLHRAIDQDLDRLPAVGTLNGGGIEI